MQDADNPYVLLANEIILEAVKEYRCALKKLSRGRVNKSAEISKQEILRFFRSDWFGNLTQIDPEVLICKLDEEVEE